MKFGRRISKTNERAIEILNLFDFVLRFITNIKMAIDLTGMFGRNLLTPKFNSMCDLFIRSFLTKKLSRATVLIATIATQSVLRASVSNPF